MNGEEEQPNVSGVKESIEQILGSETNLKKRRKTPEEVEKEKFVKLIHNIEEVYARTQLTAEIALDTSKYDEGFYQIIDSLIELHFGKDVSKIIYHYLYRNKNEPKKIVDNNGAEIPLESASDLFSLVKILQEFKFASKTKK
jgi:hypothetical protein